MTGISALPGPWWGCQNRFVISPRPGGSFTFAKASYNSVFGKVESEWEKKDGKVVYNVVIPANCEAKIILPGGTELTAGPGEHFFEE